MGSHDQKISPHLTDVSIKAFHHRPGFHMARDGDITAGENDPLLELLVIALSVAFRKDEAPILSPLLSPIHSLRGLQGRGVTTVTILTSPPLLQAMPRATGKASSPKGDPSTGTTISLNMAIPKPANL